MSNWHEIYKCLMCNHNGIGANIGVESTCENCGSLFILPRRVMSAPIKHGAKLRLIRKGKAHLTLIKGDKI